MLKSLCRKLKYSNFKRLITFGLASISAIFLGIISGHPYLLENPRWLFSKPSNEIIIQSLPSTKEVDYRPLKFLLEAQQWEAADKETQKILRTLFQKINHLLPQRANDIQKLPCTDLLTIDRLWLKYSHERFGFSAQKWIVEADNRLESPDQIRQRCANQCPQEERRTILAARCEQKCESQRIKAQFERIPEKMGRDRTSAGTELPVGYYPSPIDGVLGHKSDVYRELAKRATQCEL